MGESGDRQALMAAFRAGCDDYIDSQLGPRSIASHVRTFLRSRHEGFQPTQMLGNEDTALEGALAHLELPGVIQMLSQSRQTGALHVECRELPTEPSSSRTARCPCGNGRLGGRTGRVACRQRL